MVEILFGVPGLVISGVLAFIVYKRMDSNSDPSPAIFLAGLLIWFVSAAFMILFALITPDLMTEEEVLACIKREENVVVEQLGTTVCDDYRSYCRLERASFNTVEGQRGTVFYDDADCSIDW